MSEVATPLGAFLIGRADASPQLRQQLLALEERQTVELVVDGQRGWWERQGGPDGEFALMTPSLRTRLAMAERGARATARSYVVRPNDAEEAEAFFTPFPPYAAAVATQRAEAGRRLLALAGMGWRSSSRWYGDRGELHER